MRVFSFTLFCIICNFLLFLPVAYSGNYYGTYCTIGEAKAALPVDGSAISTGCGAPDCYGCVSQREYRDENGDWVYAYAFYYIGGAGCPPCEPDEELAASIIVSVTGPGFVDGTACGEDIQCPGGQCSGMQDGGSCSGTLTAHGNMEGVNVTWDVSDDCTINGNTVTCAVSPGETATVKASFDDICVIDSDGDGIPDGLDLADQNEGEDQPVLTFIKGILSLSGSEELYPIFENVVEVLSGLQDASSFDMNEALSDPELLNNTYFVLRNTLTGEDFTLGNDQLTASSDVITVDCDPRFEFCGNLSNEQLASYVPCGPGINSSILDEPISDADLPSPSPMDDIPQVPDGVYDTPDASCSCFETVNHNTAATVDALKGLQTINNAIAENTGKTVIQLSETNKLLEKISKKNFSSDFEDKDDFDQDDVDDIIDSMNDDARWAETDGGGIEAIENNDDNKQIASYDDTSNDQIEALIETEKQGYVDDITNYNNDLNSFISGKFQVSVSNPTCTFTAPVFGGNNITFDGCGYASVLSTMGAFIKFISYLTGIIIILRA